MFPLKDDNPTEITPYVTFALIAANAVVWLGLQDAGAGQGFLRSLCEWGTIPGEVTGAYEPGEVVERGPFSCEIGGASQSTLLSSMFMHGSWGHLIGNMWFLWVFGNNIEDSMGHGRFLGFYLLAGVAGALAHILSAPDSPVPTVGASGAISGVMGAYLLLYPKVRVHTLFFFFLFIRVIPLPAWGLLVYWFGLQLLLGGAGTLGGGGGVAYWAHVGGFAAGAALIHLFVDRARLAAHTSDGRGSPGPGGGWRS